MPEESQPPEIKKGRVGPALKQRRQALRMSLAQVELETKIRGKFLTAFESGDYSSLSNDVYSRGFVQHYANHLGLDGVQVAADYVAERGGIAAGETKSPRLVRSRGPVFTGPIVAALGGLLVTLGVVSYLLWQFSALAAPPRLTVTSPNGDQAIAGGVIEVNGHATPGSDVNVNDSPVLTDTDGNFSEKVALQNGVNPIRITARSKLGKSTIVARNVLATLPRVDAAQAVVPDKPLTSGVSVAVSVKETTSLVVAVDGKEVWRGTVVAGWSKTFTAGDNVNLTTGNAGATSVTVTNMVGAGKKLSPLGREGEIRRNQVLAKDTVIP